MTIMVVVFKPLSFCGTLLEEFNTQWDHQGRAAKVEFHKKTKPFMIPERGGEDEP